MERLLIKGDSWRLESDVFIEDKVCYITTHACGVKRLTCIPLNHADLKKLVDFLNTALLHLDPSTIHHEVTAEQTNKDGWITVEVPDDKSTKA